MAEKVAKLGLSVGMTGGGGERPTGMRFRLDAGGRQLEGHFLTGPAEGGELGLAIEQEARGDADRAEPTYRLVVWSGSEREEHGGLTLSTQKADVATKVNASSKLIRLEETG